MQRQRGVCEENGLCSRVSAGERDKEDQLASSHGSAIVDFVPKLDSQDIPVSTQRHEGSSMDSLGLFRM